MKFIIKSQAPPELSDFVARNNQRDYEALKKPARDALRKALLAEQGYICAYTMVRMHSVDDAHVEHMISRQQDSRHQLDFGNMVACYPARRQDKLAAFGAFKKHGEQISDVNFVKPTSKDCEQQFRYLSNGDIDGLTPAAKSTINMLKLNHSHLKAQRAQAISARELTNRVRSTRNAVQKLDEDQAAAASDEMTANEARQLAGAIVKRDDNGKFAGFCLAIRQVALEYADKKEAQA